MYIDYLKDKDPSSVKFFDESGIPARSFSVRYFALAVDVKPLLRNSPAYIIKSGFMTVPAWPTHGEPSKISNWQVVFENQNMLFVYSGISIYPGILKWLICLIFHFTGFMSDVVSAFVSVVFCANLSSMYLTIKVLRKIRDLRSC